MATTIYELLYNRILDITACIHIPLKLFTIYVVLRHTPPPLRHYSFFILNTMIWNFVANVIGAFIHVLPMFPTLCYRVDGKSSSDDSELLIAHLIYFVALVCITQFGLALAFAFPHRYIVIAHPKLALRIKPAWVFGLCGGVHAALLFFALIYAWKYTYDDNSNLPDRPFVFCFDHDDSQNAIYDIAYLTGTTIVFLVIAVSSVLLIWKLKQMKNRIVHDATLALQKKVFSNLLMLTAIAVLFYCVPVVLLHCQALIADSPYRQETTMACIVVLANHGSISDITYLLFFKAYRDAVRRIFTNLIARLGWKSRVRSVVVKPSSSDATSAGKVR